jgi:hypothetical protein
MVTIRIVRSRGNYVEGAEFPVDAQIAAQLITEGTARIVEIFPAAELVTEKPASVPVPKVEPEPDPPVVEKKPEIWPESMLTGKSKDKRKK